MSSTAQLPLRSALQSAACSVLAAPVRGLYALIQSTPTLFLLCLLAMLFRPPDFQFYSVDRMAFAVLAFIVLLQVVTERGAFQLTGSVSWAMLALLILATCSILTQPYDRQAWCLIAAKFIVPYLLFHLSAFVFNNPSTWEKIELFSLLVLGYLIFTAIAFLTDTKWLIFPRFILDETLGIHADRARGPFLQAVANGVTLNILGLIAIDSYQRGRLRGAWAFLMLTTLPLAIIATMTRAVWISFFASVAFLCYRSNSGRLRRACFSIAICAIALLAVAVTSERVGATLGDRAEESGPVELRLGVYEAGWNMFLEHPVFGWGLNQMPSELARRVSDRNVAALWAHNSYLEVLTEHGIVGFTLYAWLLIGIFRLPRRRPHNSQTGPRGTGEPFRRIWPIVVFVYLFNAFFVVMNYQFVNALFFTLAGIIEAENQGAKRMLRRQS